MFNDYVIGEVILFILNIAFLIGSNSMFKFFYQDEPKTAKIKGYFSYTISSILLILQSIYIFKVSILNQDIEFFNSIIGKTITTFFILYTYLLIQSITHYFFKVKYGDSKEIDGKKIYRESHYSRLWTILISVITFFISIYFLVKLWAATSLLETTGIIGFTIAALAFTNGVWLPDLYRGLVALKVKSLDIGHVIKIDESNNYYIVKDISFFHITLFDIIDNSQRFIWNNRLNSIDIQNYTKLGGIHGIRKTFTYKVSYPNVDNIESSEDRLKIIKDYLNKMNKLVEECFEEISQDNSIKINRNKPFKLLMLNSGDYAIEFIMSFYIEKLPETIITDKIRQYIIDTPLKVNEKILELSYKYNIMLSTPTLVDINNIKG